MLLFLFALLIPACSTSDKKIIKGRIIISGITKGNILPAKGQEDSPYPGRDIGGSQFLASKIKSLSLEAKNKEMFPIYVDIGDAFSGSPEALFTRGKAVMEVFNLLPLEMMLIGNFDFTIGTSMLRNLSKNTNFPLLASNIRTDSEKFFKESIILNRGGLKIAFLGQVPPDTPQMTLPENIQNLKFIASDSLLIDMATRLKKNSGVHIVILLSQKNFERSSDFEAFKTQNAIDLVIALDYQKEIVQPFKFGNTWVKLISGYNRGRELDFVDFEYRFGYEPGQSATFRNGGRFPLLNDSIEPDPGMVNLISNYVRKIDQLKSREIGTIAYNLTRAYEKESPLGNFITDAMRFATGVSIAFQNSGAIQNDLRKGVISEGDLYTAIPFENSLITIDLSGVEIMRILEISSARRAGVLQVSGINYSYSTKKNIGKRVEIVKIEGKELDLKKNYSVAINDFLYRGGDGFTPFKNGKNFKIWGSLREAVRDYLVQSSDKTTTNYAEPQGRINEIK
ncbi:bifunctional metallophosphatase/5'-nucleotidase [Candidatus Riflebacteria bacterium]